MKQTLDQHMRNALLLYFPQLTLELDPFKPDVYYDLPPKRENRLAGARLLRLS